ELSLRLGNVRGLRSFLSLHDLEVHSIAFLKALVTLRANSAVVDEHVWPIVSADEAVTFGVIEPLHSTFQAIHVLPLLSAKILTLSRIEALCGRHVGHCQDGKDSISARKYQCSGYGNCST